MNKKYFIRGFGVGILFATIILTISGSRLNSNSLTDKEIIEKAKQLGMVYIDEEDKKLEDIITEGTKVPSPSSTPNPSKVPEAESTIEPSKEPTEESTNEPEATIEPEKPLDNSNQTTNKTATLVVEKGMYSSTVTNQLEEIGVIENAKEFDQYLMKYGYANRIRIGSYEIEIGADYSTIAKMITK